MKNTITIAMQESFNRLMFNLGIEPAEIEVNDPEIVEPQTNVERFYNWLQRCGNIHLNDNEQIVKSFNKIANYDN